jgi:phosphatidylinositol glycan class O
MFARGVNSDRGALTPLLLGWGLAGTVIGAALGALAGIVPSFTFLHTLAFGAALGGVVGMSLGFYPAREALRVPYPRTFWGGLSALTCVMLCIGFASNSFTIWEDEQLLFFLTTFGVLMLASSLGLEDTADRNMGAANAISFIVATRLSSVFRLCREEQMPFCRSTYYASATSSTSATWQLVIPFVVALTLPSAMQYFYHRTKNYQGSGVIWIGIALRIGLVFVSLYWFLDAADDGDWYPSISKSLLKTTRITLAQITFALAFAAGYATYICASPLIAVIEEAAPPEPLPASLMESPDPSGGIFTSFAPPPKPRSKLIILGYANTHGTRYFLLPAAWLLALLLVQKPVGQGTLALCMISILNVLEIIDANNLRRSALGPTVLALLGSYYFFKTGHQAVLSTIQWETAFIPFKTIIYPFSPLVVLLNTFGPQILCAIAVPAIPLWKTRPKYPGLLGRVAGAMATHMLFYAAIAVATVIEAAWLRRHLMLYRIFMPRMLMGVTVMMVVEIVAALVAIMGVRWSVTSVADIFGWEIS